MADRRRRKTGSQAVSSWCVFIFCGTPTAVVACGGAIVAETTSEAGVDGSSHVSDASSYDQSCSIGSYCAGNAGDGRSGGDHDGETEQDALVDSEIVSDGSLLCGYRTGPIPPGVDGGGPAIQCRPGWVCITLNGGWACCNVQGTGPSTCLQPFFTDGGT